MATPTVRGYYSGVKNSNRNVASGWNWDVAPVAGDRLWIVNPVVPWPPDSTSQRLVPAGWTLVSLASMNQDGRLYYTQLLTRVADGSGLDTPTYTAYTSYNLDALGFAAGGIATVGESVQKIEAGYSWAYGQATTYETINFPSPGTLDISDGLQVTFAHMADYYGSPGVGSLTVPSGFTFRKETAFWWEPYGPGIDWMQVSTKVLSTNAPGVVTNPTIYYQSYYGSTAGVSATLILGASGGPSFSPNRAGQHNF
jgi:hypothetical protein